MKKIYILLLTVCMISLSCETPDSSPQVIGFTTSEDGKTDVVKLVQMTLMQSGNHILMLITLEMQRELEL